MYFPLPIKKAHLLCTLYWCRRWDLLRSAFSPPRSEHPHGMLFSLRFKSSFPLPIKKAHLRCTLLLVPKVGFAPLRFLASSFRACPRHALFSPVQILFPLTNKKSTPAVYSFIGAEGGICSAPLSRLLVQSMPPACSFLSGSNPLSPSQ